MYEFRNSFYSNSVYFYCIIKVSVLGYIGVGFRCKLLVFGDIKKFPKCLLLNQRKMEVSVPF